MYEYMTKIGHGEKGQGQIVATIHIFLNLVCEVIGKNMIPIQVEVSISRVNALQQS